MISLILFAFASTTVMTSIAFGTPTLDTTSITVYDVESEVVQPTGDPIDDEEFAPM